MKTPDPSVLTPVQRAMIRFIYSQFRANHMVPTYREIMTQFDYRSTNAVTGHLKLLARKGWIEFTYEKGEETRKARGFKLPAVSQAVETAADQVLTILN